MNSPAIAAPTADSTDCETDVSMTQMPTATITSVRKGCLMINLRANFGAE